MKKGEKRGKKRKRGDKRPLQGLRKVIVVEARKVKC